MPVPVFEISESKPKAAVHTDSERVSGAAAFFAMILILIMAITIELGLLDINKHFNPQFAQCKASGTSLQRIFETPRVVGNCDLQQYEAARLLLHADVIVPAALICIVAVVLLNMNKKNLINKIFRVVLTIFSSWITIRLVYEALAYSLKHHPLYGKYFVLLTAVIIIICMIVWIQRSLNKKPTSSAPTH
ncbi:MAG: hypothetical protein ACOYUK_03065 [Patescibacteria group bacterium]